MPSSDDVVDPSALPDLRLTGLGAAAPSAQLAGARRVGIGMAIGRRLATMLLVLLVMSFGIFMLQYLAPGGVMTALTGGRPLRPETAAHLRHQYNLDRPLLVQYAIWLRHAVTGDLGVSYRNNQEVTYLVLSRGALTLQLAALAFVIALVVGLPLAVVAAVRRRRFADRLISSGAALGIAAPPFAVGVLLLYVFGVRLGWFPVFGAGSGFLNRITHLVLPATALSVAVIALILKVSRAALIESLEQEYVTFARSRGVSRRRVILTYAVRNSLAPIITTAGLTLTALVSSTVLVEQTFAVPGAGNLLIDAVTNRDVPVVQGLSLMIAAVILLINLLADVAYAVLDPRIDLSRSMS